MQRTDAGFSRMLTSSSTGRTILRVIVWRGGAPVATFFLAVFAHPGSKGRSATDGDIEVPAMMLLDLYDGHAYMDTLHIHADQLDAALLKSAAVEVAQQARAGAVPENQELRFREQVMAAAAAIGEVPPPA